MIIDICAVIIIQGKMFLNVKIVESKSNNKDNYNAKKPLKLKVIEVTMQEIWQQTTPKIHTSKKVYKRNKKHKNKDL